MWSASHSSTGVSLLLLLTTRVMRERGDAKPLIAMEFADSEQRMGGDGRSSSVQTGLGL